MSTLVIACGALAVELRELTDAQDSLTVEYLPARLHNTPERIPSEVDERIDLATDRYERIFVGYADCGTGGTLDAVLSRRGIERLPGAHCYEFFATSPVFSDLHDTEPGTFYLTDFLVRHFRRLVIEGLGLDRHPQLRDDYFAAYRRVVHLAQVDDPVLEASGRRAAAELGLEYERIVVGCGELREAVDRLGRS